MSDEDRLKLLKTTPFKFDQAGHGCCGPSGALMGLLTHAKEEVDALYKCFHESGTYRGIEGSEEVSTKLVKRLSVKVLDENKPNFLDLKLAIGLLLTLKAALAKAPGKANVFKECEEYSKLWENWTRGDKLSSGAAVAPFSYKHGDIALTTEATKFMLEMVGFIGVEAKDLIANDKLVAERAKLDKLDTNADLLKAIGEVHAKSGYSGALIGVAKKVFLEDAKVKEAAKYDHIAHWVYMPKQSVPKNLFETEVWTWGDKTTFTKLLKDNKTYPAVYIPKVAVTFKAWKKK